MLSLMSTNIISTNSIDAAKQLLKDSGIGLIDAIILSLELIRECKGRGDVLKRAREGIRLGADALKKLNRSVSFEKALNETIKSKAHRRIRTIKDIQYSMNQLLRACPELQRRQMRGITPEECADYLRRGFDSDRQRYKGRVVLNGIFSLAHKRGWCDENPIERVDVPPIQEKMVCSLDIDEIECLLYAALEPEFESCGPGLGLMLYAGIRPTEVRRLHWSNINFTEKIITIMPEHSKTGGARHVTILPVLDKWLQLFSNNNSPDELICLPNWLTVWKALRKSAGWGTSGGLTRWPQDCLRHSFASYHVKMFRNFTDLQIEMGHRSSSLLRTRYLNMNGITSESAERFWRGIL